jgi:spore germination protein KB
MEQHKGKIGIREYIAIITMAIGTKLADDTPAILLNHLGNAAWMTPILSGALAFIPIMLLIRVFSKYPNQGLMDILQLLFGRYLGYFLVLNLWLVGMTLNAIDTAIYTDIIGTMYFTETPTLYIFIVLMAVSAYGAIKGLEQIGSIAWSVLPYLKVSLLIALVLALSKGSINHLFPLLGPGTWEIVKESSLKVSIYSDIFYLGMLAAYMSNTKELKKGTIISIVILLIEFPFALVCYISLFDYESAKLLNYPFHETIRYISLGFLTNIETFFFPFWLVASFVRFSIYLYISAIMFGWLFKIKQFESLIPIMATIIVIFGMAPETPTFSTAKIKEILLNLATPAFFLIPVFLWIRSKMKGGIRNEKANQ